MVFYEQFICFDHSLVSVLQAFITRNMWLILFEKIMVHIRTHVYLPPHRIDLTNYQYIRAGENLYNGKVPTYLRGIFGMCCLGMWHSLVRRCFGMQSGVRGCVCNCVYACVEDLTGGGRGRPGATAAWSSARWPRAGATSSWRRPPARRWTTPTVPVSYRLIMSNEI